MKPNIASLSKETPRRGETPNPATSYEVLVDSEAFLTDVERLLSQARSSVQVQFHIFEADNTGRRFAQALFKVAQRGVSVQLVIDHYGDLFQSDQFIHLPRFKRSVQQALRRERRAMYELFEVMQAEGIQIRRTNPLGFLGWKTLWRDHKKLLVIDGDDRKHRTAYIGGLNIADHHAAWHDFMVKMQGDLVEHIHADFRRTWNGVTHATGQVIGDDGLVLIDTWGRSPIFAMAQHLLTAATQRIVLESPYVWGRNIERCLLKAASRGIDVTLIVPLHNNHRFPVLTAQRLRALAEQGVNVCRYAQHGGMTHAKALLVDDQALFGSSNFNQFLAGKLAELSVVTREHTLVSQLDRMLATDIASSVQEFSSRRRRKPAL